MMMMMGPSGRYGARHLPGAAAFARTTVLFEKKKCASDIRLLRVRLLLSLLFDPLLLLLFFILSLRAIYIHRHGICTYIHTLVLTDVPHKRRTAAASWFKSESCRK